MRRSLPLRALAQNLQSSVPGTAASTSALGKSSASASAAVASSSIASTSRSLRTDSQASTSNAAEAHVASTQPRFRRRSTRRRPGFFDSLRAFNPAPQEHGNDRPCQGEVARKALIAELYKPRSHGSADRVWAAYTRLAEQQIASGQESRLPMHELKLQHHRQVLRAISCNRSPQQDGHRERLASGMVAEKHVDASRVASSSGSTGASILAYRHRPDPVTAESVSTFIQRLWVWLGHVREATQTEQRVRDRMGYTGDPLTFPSLRDCNYILEQLAPHGSIEAAEGIWALLSHQSPSFPVTSNVLPLALSSPGLSRPKPDQRTYHFMLLCLSKALASSLQEIQATHNKVLRHDHFARLQGQLDHKEHDFPPEARRACWIAAARVIALVQEMRQGGIEPVRLTYDLALRTLRQAGHLSGFKSLVETGYGISLDHPDASSSTSSSSKTELSVHALNTIVMTLGEQSTVSEMVAAYETLVRPLPRSIERAVIPSADKAPQRERLFAIDWDAMLNRPLTESQAEDSTDTIVPEVFAYEATGAPSPNTTTITRMVQLCADVPIQGRAGGSQLDALLGRRTSHSAEEERRLRKRGAYMPIAKYLLAEALQMYEASVQRSRTLLGVDVDALKDIIPRYAPPCLVPNSHMVGSLLSRSYNWQVAGSERLGHFCETWIEKSLALQQDELDMLKKALETWQQHSQVSDEAQEQADAAAGREEPAGASRTTVNSEYNSLVTAMRAQYSFVQREMQELRTLHDDFVQRRRRWYERARDRIVRRSQASHAAYKLRKAEELRLKEAAQQELELKEMERQRRQRSKELKAEEDAKRELEESTVVATA